MAANSDLNAYHWEPHPETARLVEELVALFPAGNDDIARLADRMSQQTGTRFIDWVDSFCVATETGELAEKLSATGFQLTDSAQEGSPGWTYWYHDQGMFPKVHLSRHSKPTSDPMPIWVSIRVQRVEDFLAANPLVADVYTEGEQESSGRLTAIQQDRGPSLVLVERHGWSAGASPPSVSHEAITKATHVRQKFQQRQRQFSSLEEGFDYSRDLIAEATAQIGEDWACDLFFAAEREFWMSKNHAARVQYDRQQQLGLGWANHDHHTYRSSRECFHRLIEVLELLGMQCRERFYAGKEAGWGAQVLENPQTGIVVFADVDLSPNEITGDFSHDSLPSRDGLGTVGLWCGLHGESFLEAGMHHLECQFDFDAARQQLAAAGIETMAPFTDFPYLKQAFTEGEIWSVDKNRIDTLLNAGSITNEQAEQFRQEGALGSHMEILQRDDGYKGFNQTGVSDIIGRTDPRKW